jgi:DNA-binding Lrp family transcriptional regulator
MKLDRVYREILYRVYEEGEAFMSQREVSKVCGVSIGLVNLLVSRMEGLGAVERRPMGFRVIDPKKMLQHWAARRNLKRDLVYSTFVPEPAEEIEGSLREGVFTAYSGCRLRFGLEEDYSEVYFYGDPEAVRALYPPSPHAPNLHVLTSDPHLTFRSKHSVAPLPQLYVDLWQLGRPAERWLAELEERMEAAQVEILKRWAGYRR